MWQPKGALRVTASSNKKILIMGGTRFIGVFMSRLLVKEGHQVSASCMPSFPHCFSCQSSLKPCSFQTPFSAFIAYLAILVGYFVYQRKSTHHSTIAWWVGQGLRWFFVQGNCIRRSHVLRIIYLTKFCLIVLSFLYLMSTFSVRSCIWKETERILILLNLVLLQKALTLFMTLTVWSDFLVSLSLNAFDIHMV